MKKWLIFFVVIGIFFGCTAEIPVPPSELSPLQEEILPDETLPSATKGDIPPPPSVPGTQPIVESPLAPVVTEKKKAPEMSKLLADLISRSDKRVQSYEFFYAPPPENIPHDRYYFRGNKMRMIAGDMKRHSTALFFNNLYVDIEKQKALAFCEGRDARCTKARQKTPVDYTPYVVKTPYQWVKQIPYGEIIGTQTLFDRTTTEVHYEKDGVDYRLWVDSHYGLVVRAVIDDKQKVQRYDYLDLRMNTARDEFFEPPTGWN